MYFYCKKTLLLVDKKRLEESNSFFCLALSVKVGWGNKHQIKSGLGWFHIPSSPYLFNIPIFSSFLQIYPPLIITNHELWQCRDSILTSKQSNTPKYMWFYHCFHTCLFNLYNIWRIVLNTLTIFVYFLPKLWCSCT